jgi:flagellar FliJ protein
VPRFQFRLQPVLDHKQRQEDLAQIELAQAQTAQLKEENALQLLNQAEVNAIEELERQRFTGRLDIEALQLGLGYMDVLKAQILRQGQIVLRVKQQTETKRQELVARVQERKTLEKLRERQLDAFTREQNRIEARDADELVIMRHAHQRTVAASHAAQGAR